MKSSPLPSFAQGFSMVPTPWVKPSRTKNFNLRSRRVLARLGRDFLQELKNDRATTKPAAAVELFSIRVSRIGLLSSSPFSFFSSAGGKNVVRNAIMRWLFYRGGANAKGLVLGVLDLCFLGLFYSIEFMRILKKNKGSIFSMNIIQINNFSKYWNFNVF